jgi:hypothetical protein
MHDSLAKIAAYRWWQLGILGRSCAIPRAAC